MYETGAEIRFDCEYCLREVVVNLGGPDLTFGQGVQCPNPRCSAQWLVRYEVEPEQPAPWGS